MTFSQRLHTLALQANQDFQHATSLLDLERLEITYLGRKGELTNLMKELGSVSAEERPRLGEEANRVKQELAATLTARRGQLAGNEQGVALEREREDVTEPGLRPPEGHLHLMTQAIREMTELFARIGFVRTRYPEVEWDWYAFEALNMPADHPARDEWETFFMDAPVGTKPREGKMVLTPHTSNGQIHEMRKGVLPIRMINIAKTYRRQVDATHLPMFHQIEGLYVDKGVAITHLRGILDYFAKGFFGPDRKTRLRPFHFRFTEPSFEIDVSCGVCGGTGFLRETSNPKPLTQTRSDDKGYRLKVIGSKCRVCKQGWVEIGGAGMVHPNVLKACGVDAKTYSGFAFGWGVERTYMMKQGLQVDDIRTLYRNDLRFLQQF